MRRVMAVLAAAALAACGSNGDNESGESTGGFAERLAGGAGCAELFDIRNKHDPKSPLIDEMNEQLREVGCYMSSSTRTD